MNDRELVEALLNKDPFVTKLFYYRNCRPLFLSLIHRLEHDGRVWEYDEVVSEIYALLMENDGRRLRSFGFECSFYQWVKVVALRHLIAKMDKQKGKELSNGLMEIDMKANIKMIERMAKGFIFIIMVIDMKENGNKV